MPESLDHIMRHIKVSSSFSSISIPPIFSHLNESGKRHLLDTDNKILAQKIEDYEA